MKPHSTKIFRDIVNALGAFIQSQFMNQPGGPASQSGKSWLFVFLGVGGGGGGGGAAIICGSK